MDPEKTLVRPGTEQEIHENVRSSTSSQAPSTTEFEKETNTAQTGVRRVSSTPSTRAQAILHEVREQTGAHEGEDDMEYPSSWKLAVVTLALCLAVFCMALDNTIIATAIPRITDQFNSINDVGWYGSAYLLTTCALQLFFGKLYTFYSIKWVFLAAIFIFEVGSAVCGAAPTSNALIVGRAVAGVGAAGVFSGAILIVAHTVPLAKRPMYTGLIASMYGIASVAGPLMGGAFTDKVTWRWCFYINLPIGAITIGFIAIFFDAPVNRDADRGLTRTESGNHMVRMNWKQQLQQFDLIGTAVFLPAIVCLLLALQWGGSKYHWGNWRIILCLVVAALLLCAFVAIQFWKGENATVPPRVMKQRTVASASFFIACLGGAFFVMVYYIPIWFQAIKGVSAVHSGIDNLPLILGLVIISLVAGGLVTWLGYYTPFVIIGSILMSIGAGLISTWTVDTQHPAWIGYQALFGFGVGFSMQQPLMAVQAVLPMRDVPVGTAIIMFSQTFGGALFISVGQNVFTNQLLKNLKAVAPNVSSSLVLKTGATNLRNKIDAGDLGNVLIAYNGALTTTYYVSVALAAASIIGAVLMEVKSLKGKKVEVAMG